MIAKILLFGAHILMKLAAYCTRNAKIIAKENNLELIETTQGIKMWTLPESWLTISMKQAGDFEHNTLVSVRRLVRPGSIVLDIGANIGYYTLEFSKLVGPNGHVYAFEPVSRFFSILKKNTGMLNVQNISLFNFGLSNEDCTCDIFIDQSSATMHPFIRSDAEKFENDQINLRSVEHALKENDITTIDFIKIDVDGHEPIILNELDKFISSKTIILLEVAHANYLKCNTTAWDFYDFLKSKGYNIWDEKQLSPITTQEDFLILCGNFAYSRNIFIRKNDNIFS